MNLYVDPDRLDFEDTGIYVRAQHPEGSWAPYDIIHLTKESLLELLRSRGGHNPWAENVVGHLLGHGNLVEPKLESHPTSGILPEDR